MIYVLYSIAAVYGIGFILTVVQALRHKRGLLCLYFGLVWPETVVSNLLYWHKDKQQLTAIQDDPLAVMHLVNLITDYPTVDELFKALATNEKLEDYPHPNSVVWLLCHTKSPRALRILWKALTEA